VSSRSGAVLVAQTAIRFLIVHHQVTAAAAAAVASITASLMSFVGYSSRKSIDRQVTPTPRHSLSYLATCFQYDASQAQVEVSKVENVLR